MRFRRSLRTRRSSTYSSLFSNASAEDEKVLLEVRGPPWEGDAPPNAVRLDKFRLLVVVQPDKEALRVDLSDDAANLLVQLGIPVVRKCHINHISDGEAHDKVPQLLQLALLLRKGDAVLAKGRHGSALTP